MTAKPNLAMAQATTKAQKTKGCIYEAALKLFEEKGFEKTTMREIAQKAGVALGGAYYYFKSKEEIVMCFYEHNQVTLNEKAREIFSQTPDLKGRLMAFLKMQFDYFNSYRSIFGVLARIAGDPNHPLSPFSEQTQSIRDQSVGIFKEVLEGPKIKIPKDLKPHLPYLLWLYHMGLIYFWIHDSSKDQNKTGRLLEISLLIVTRLIKLSHYPLMSSVRKLVLNLLNDMNVKEREIDK